MDKKTLGTYNKIQNIVINRHGFDDHKRLEQAFLLGPELLEALVYLLDSYETKYLNHNTEHELLDAGSPIGFAHGILKKAGVKA